MAPGARGGGGVTVPEVYVALRDAGSGDGLPVGEELRALFQPSRFCNSQSQALSELAATAVGRCGSASHFSSATSPHAHSPPLVQVPTAASRVPPVPRPRTGRHSRPGRAASRSRHLLLPVVETHAALLEHQRLSQLQQPAGPGEPIHGGPGGTLPSPGDTGPQPPLSSGRHRASTALPQPLQPRRCGALQRQPEK